MILSYKKLLELVQRGVITGVTPDLINAASIDVTLGPKILVEQEWQGPAVRLDRRETPLFKELPLYTSSYYYLRPGEFILAQTEQVFNLPNNISAEYKLKSSMARMGLEHLNAGWCDAGWGGSVLTLELKNMTQHHTIAIKRGDKIGQMVFFPHDPVSDEASYATKGSYNRTTQVTAAIPANNNVGETLHAYLRPFDQLALLPQSQGTIVPMDSATEVRPYTKPACEEAPTEYRDACYVQPTDSGD